MTPIGLGYLSEESTPSQLVRHVWRSSRTQWAGLGMVKQTVSPAGCAESPRSNSKSLRSTALIWDARFVGFRSLNFSCAHATVAHTTRTAAGPPVLRNVVSLP